ncbi:MAG TPA: hypothetical protein VGP76_29735 [Planctomycetaceae bacterium]|jgi:hypothetical protein|nr:hypothetical protein [Planctomycetaceae bacterium]
MKSYRLLARLARPFAHPWHRLAQTRRDAVKFVSARRGTVIIVVLALLGMLALIGFFVFAFTASENQSATYFANSPTAKSTAIGLDADQFFNDVLRQIIIGPSLAEKQSALWGGNKSLLPTMYGRDLAVFNGQGVNWVWNSTTGQPSVDQNYNGIPDDTEVGLATNVSFLQLNLSPAAQNSLLDLNNFPAAGTAFPDPDTNTTYPDINSAFLAYDALIPNPTSATLLTRLITPSFHRPQLLRNANASAGGTVPTQRWYIDPGTAKSVIYPHSEHLAINNAGAITATQRFVTTIHPDTSGIGVALNPFPIPGDLGQLPTVSPPQEGVWTSFPAWAATTAYLAGAQVIPTPATGQVFTCTTAGTSGTTQPVWPSTPQATVTDGSVVWTDTGPTLNYLVDTDNDGIPDSNYIDFGMPLMTTTDGTQQFVALAAVKLIDTDALFNLNAHGNRTAPVVLGPAPIPVPFGPFNSATTSTLPQFISRSNQGVSASEVNPEWALNARPVAANPDFSGNLAALTSALTQYVSFFRSPPQSNTLPSDDHSAGNYELANMEWWNILNGRPQLTPSATPTTVAATVTGSSLPGRWGENVARLDPNVLAVLNGATVVSAGLCPPATPTFNGDPWPLPGTSGVDDNFNQLESGIFQDEQGIVHPAFVTPLDFFASGTSFSAPAPTEGRVRLLFPEGVQKFLQYSNYFVNSNVQWTTFFSGGLMAGGGAQLLIDDADETFTEPSAAATQPNDNIFGAGENVLQLQGSDFQTFGSGARTPSLASFNFGSSARAGQIRQRFTSTSWDLKSFGKEFLGVYAGTNDARRLWEFTGTGLGPYRFPPDFGGGAVPAPALGVTASSNYPLRPDLAHLLWTLADPNQQLGSTAQILPQRPMSINGLVEQIQANNSSGFTFRFRPLTPHPTTNNPNFPNTPIWDPSYGGSGSNYPTQVPFPGLTRPEQLAANNLAQQEWLARYDRQRLARDIYTLLYLTGGGNDSINYATTSNQPVPATGIRPVYTDDQLREMAQFAVNTVDQLDPDSNITVFEYDKDLSDGWNLDDNAYDGTADAINLPPISHPLDRGVVYGVERQQLCFNEAMVTYSQQCINTKSIPPNQPQDHPDTQWDDSKVWSFIYMELENIGPTAVNFANRQWEIAVKQSPLMASTTVPALYGSNPNYLSSGPSGEMRLLFSSSFLPGGIPAGQNGAPPANSKITIGGMVGSPDGINFNIQNTSAGNPVPSYMVLDPNHGDPIYGGSAYDNQTAPVGFPIAPRGAFVSPTSNPFTGNPNALTLDLMQSASSLYFVEPPNTNSPPGGDGAPVAPALISPGSALLQFNDPLHQILPSNGSIVLRLELRRRVDPNRAPPNLIGDATNAQQCADNPWVVVDYVDVPVSVLALKITGAANNADNYLQLQGQLGGFYNATWPATIGPSGVANSAAYAAAAYYPYLPSGSPPNVSTERSQPLYHDYQLNPFNPASSPGSLPGGPFLQATAVLYNRNGGSKTLVSPLWQGNSLGQDNDAAGYNPGTQPAGTTPPNPPVPTPIPPHPLYQPHNDRDFASVAELFNVPLYGQSQTVAWVPTSAYIVGTTIVPPSAAGLTFTCTKAGTSGATSPAWPITPGTPVGDNTVIWTSGTAAPLLSGVTHLLASRTNEAGNFAATPLPTPELLSGADFIPTDSTLMPSQHYSGYGVAGYRFLHPDSTGTTRWAATTTHAVGDRVVPTPANSNGFSYRCLVAAGPAGAAEPVWPTVLGTKVIDGALQWICDGQDVNRWHRLFTYVEVPTRSHRQLEDPPYQITAGVIGSSLGTYFYRTPGKINLNTVRHPDVLAGLLDESDIFSLNYSSAFPGGLNFPQGLSVPLSLPDQNGDQVSVPTPGTIRDWWLQFVTARDGIDPLPTTAVPTGGSGLALPGMPPAVSGSPAVSGVIPGSHPFRGPGFSSFGSVDVNGYNGPLESTILRTLPGDPVTPSAPPAYSRRQLLEVGISNPVLANLNTTLPPPENDHLADAVDYATKNRVLSKILQNSTTRSNVFLAWIQIDFFQAKDVNPPNGVVRIGSKLSTSPAYRGFFVIDRSQAMSLMGQQFLPANTPGTPFVFSLNQSFNYQSLILFQQRIQ